MNVAAELHHILQIHKEDVDGGYSAVRDLLVWFNQQSETHRDEIRRFLLDKVRRFERREWGIALEVLVNDGSTETEGELESLIAKVNDFDRENQVALALARLGAKRSLATLTRVARQGLAAEKIEVGSLIANIAHVDADLSVNLGIEFFTHFLRAQEPRFGAIGYVPAFLRVYLSATPNSIAALVQGASEKDPAKGQLLRDEVLRVLNQPSFSNVPESERGRVMDSIRSTGKPT